MLFALVLHWRVVGRVTREAAPRAGMLRLPSGSPLLSGGMGICVTWQELGPGAKTSGSSDLQEPQGLSLSEYSR